MHALVWEVAPNPKRYGRNMAHPLIVARWNSVKKWLPEHGKIEKSKEQLVRQENHKSQITRQSNQYKDIFKDWCLWTSVFRDLREKSSTTWSGILYKCFAPGNSQKSQTSTPPEQPYKEHKRTRTKNISPKKLCKSQNDHSCRNLQVISEGLKFCMPAFK